MNDDFLKNTYSAPPLHGIPFPILSPPLVIPWQDHGLRPYSFQMLFLLLGTFFLELYMSTTQDIIFEDYLRRSIQFDLIVFLLQQNENCRLIGLVCVEQNSKALQEGVICCSPVSKLNYFSLLHSNIETHLTHQYPRYITLLIIHSIFNYLNFETLLNFLK